MIWIEFSSRKELYCYQVSFTNKIIVRTQYSFPYIVFSKLAIFY